MRTVRLISVLAASALFVAGCNDDDNDIPPIDAEPVDADVPIDAPVVDADVDPDADLDADLVLDAAPGITEVDCDVVTPDVEIVMEDIAFVDPDDGDQTTIDQGDIVEWTNNDPEIHTVTSGSPDDPQAEQGELFASGDLDQNDSYCLQFDELGTFEYFCETHPDQMRDATITVE